MSWQGLVGHGTWETAGSPDPCICLVVEGQRTLSPLVISLFLSITLLSTLLKVQEKCLGTSEKGDSAHLPDEEQGFFKQEGFPE